MKKFLLTLITIIIMSGATCSAENLKFIDALEDTGYYYDADTVQFESSTIFAVNMVVIKANLNQMYIYDVKINHWKMTYEILSSKILSYDTRAEIKSNNYWRPVQNYSYYSEFEKMVELIIDGE